MLTGPLEPTHLILILIAACVVLGHKRIPGAGRALGQGLREFKNWIAGAKQALRLPASGPPTRDENPPVR